MFFFPYFCFFSINTEKFAIPILRPIRKYIHTFSRDFLPINYGIILVINQLLVVIIILITHYILHNVTCTPSNVIYNYTNCPPKINILLVWWSDQEIFIIWSLLDNAPNCWVHYPKEIVGNILPTIRNTWIIPANKVWLLPNFWYTTRYIQPNFLYIFF